MSEKRPAPWRGKLLWCYTKENDRGQERTFLFRASEKISTVMELEIPSLAPDESELSPDGSLGIIKCLENQNQQWKTYGGF